MGLFSFITSEPDEKVFTSPDVVWCGLDFSQVKCIGPRGFTEPDRIKDWYFAAWNTLILEEHEKYNVQEFYQKENMITDLSVTARRNRLPEANELVINEPYEFEEGQLEGIIETYSLRDVQEGLGLVYVVETLNKTYQKAVIHVVFFDIASKKILWKERYSGSPRGFGFRNYWAGAILNVMKASEKDYTMRKDTLN